MDIMLLWRKSLCLDDGVDGNKNIFLNEPNSLPRASKAASHLEFPIYRCMVASAAFANGRGDSIVALHPLSWGRCHA